MPTPRKPDAQDRPRGPIVSRAEQARRRERAAELLAARLTQPQFCAAFRKEFGCATSTAKRYRAEATAALVAAFVDPTRVAARAAGLEASYELVYRRALAADELRTAGAQLDKLTELYGLAPTQRHEVRHAGEIAHSVTLTDDELCARMLRIAGEPVRADEPGAAGDAAGGPDDARGAGAPGRAG